MDRAKVKYYFWEARPAVTAGLRAWAVLYPGGEWTEVHIAEVHDSGRRTSQSEFESWVSEKSNPPLPAEVFEQPELENDKA